MDCVLDFYLQYVKREFPNIILKKIFRQYYYFVAKRFAFFYIVQKMHFPGYGRFVGKGVWT